MMLVNSVSLLSQGLLLVSRVIQYIQEVIQVKKEYKELYEKFGLNVVFFRKRERLTQLELAELVDIDRSHISAIELGNVGVSMDVIFKMCEVLHTTPRELFDFREN